MNVLLLVARLHLSYSQKAGEYYGRKILKCLEINILFKLLCNTVAFINDDSPFLNLRHVNVDMYLNALLEIEITNLKL